MAPTPKLKARRPSKATKRSVCNADDYLLLLTYMEDMENYRRLCGSGKKTAPGVKQQTREVSWDIAATELFAQGFCAGSGAEKTTGACLYKKWTRYMVKYRLAKAAESETGGGLSETEIRDGVNLEDKLNGMCKHYYQMDGLMGSRVNISPPAVSGLMGFQTHSQAPDTVQTASSPEDPYNYDSDEATQGVEIELQQREQEILTEEYLKSKTSEPQLEMNPDAAPPDGQPHQHNTATQARPHLHGPTSTITPAPAPANQTNKKGIDPDRQKGKDPKPSLANAYLDGKMQEAEFKYKYLEKKDLWRLAEVKDKQETRAELVKNKRLKMEFSAEQMAIARNFKLKEAQTTREFKMAEADRDKFHAGELAKAKNKLDLIIHGWSQNKSPEDIATMCKLLDA